MKIIKSGFLRRALHIALLVLSIQHTVEADLISWDASYFNDVGLNASDFATFQSEIGIALNYYSTTWEAPNPVTIKVKFRAGNTGLGSTATYYDNISYQDYRNVLASSASSGNDATVLSFLPNSPSNPTNSSSDVRMTLPLKRALGFAQFPPGIEPDAEIILNTGLMTLDRIVPIDPAKYDLRQVTYHELNEVLGFTSGLNGVPNMPGPGPSGAIQPADLFRYESSGVRSWNTNTAALPPYFSIDNGVTKLAEFDVDDQADRQDFNGTFNGSPFFSAQDAFSTPGLRLDNALAEETFLDAIGYNRVAVPEPASGLLLIVGVGSVLATRRRVGC